MADIEGAAPVTASTRFNGYFDRYESGRASGWATDLAAPDQGVTLTALVDGREVASVPCDGPRPDVQAALSLPSPLVAFAFDLPDEFLDGKPRKISFRLPDGSVLPHMGAEGLASLQPHLEIADQPPVAVQGNVDGLVHNALRGWVLRKVGRSGTAHARCDVLITCENVKIAQLRADRFRRDVGNVLGCDPNCGFEFQIPHAFQKSYPQKFRVFLLPEMLELDNSPFETATVSNFLEGKLVSISNDMSRLYSDIERLRREITALLPSQGYNINDYDRWARRYYENLRARVAAERRQLRERGELPPEPFVTVMVPTYKPLLSDFVAAIDSVIAQTYENWELVIVDDGSKSREVSDKIDEYCARDKRIRCIRSKRNVGIARATNVAMEAAKGEWTVFFDHDDLLVDVALEVMIRRAQQTGAKLLYSDEDKIDQAGYFLEPNFKPDWNYRYVLGCNYVCHLTVIETATMRKVGLLKKEYDGAQDHDFILRCSEILAPSEILHVAEMLYHWRITPNSTAADVSKKGYAVDAGVRAVADHLKRKGQVAEVQSINGLTIYGVRWIPQSTPRVSIIIPFRDQIETTRECVASLLENTRYENYEIVLVDNWSTSDEAKSFVADIADMDNIRVLRVVEEFNYSRLNNLATAGNEAEFFVFMNNDVFVTDEDWLERILGEALSDEKIGIVGGKFLYPNKTVQHAGVVVGTHGVAAHIHLGIPDDDYGYIGRARLSQDLTCVTAACMLIRASVFRQVGGFDEEHLKVAYNDVDLCLKVFDNGYRIVWCADFVADHHESLSRGSDMRPDQEARFFREQQTMYERWGGKPFFRNDPYFNRNFSKVDRLFYDLEDPAQPVGAGSGSVG
ncbi:glycosyltransferase family 2 protein [Rhizosaccharibacter radicis]|uniref:Glycosyltransferase n=1 Tax=Rhizosaccharibacter radicis TaxID=2782605 RepID=A0ABT1VWI0_9PROT|nr:glycosyltransferase [Acetobacteraceae bacterium KSS12]